MTTERNFKEMIKESAEKMRDILCFINSSEKTTDTDLRFNEIKIGLAKAFGTSVDPESSEGLLSVLEDSVRIITNEYFSKSTGDAQRLLLNKCVDVFSDITGRVLRVHDPDSERYVRALQSRVQTLEVIVQILLKLRSYAELKIYTHCLAEQLEALKNAELSTGLETDKLRVRHAESVLQICRLENSARVALHSDATLECLYVARNVCSDEFPQLQKYLSLRAFAMGLDCYKNGHSEHAVTYFRESFRLGKKLTNVDRQADTLYLLGCAYLRWNKEEHWEKAVNALDMAMLHQPGILKHLTKKLEALYTSGNDKSIANTLDCILKHKEMTVKSALDIHKSLKANSLAEKAIEFLQRAYIRFGQDEDSLQVLLELLKAELKSENLDRASVTFQRVLVQGSKAQLKCRDELKQLARFLYQYGCQQAEAGNVEDAVEWLKNCDMLMGEFDEAFSADDPDDASVLDMADVKLGFAYWSAKLGKLDGVKEALQQYKGPDNVLRQYLMLKIAVQEDNSTSAMEAARLLLSLVKQSNGLERETTYRKVTSAIVHLCSYAMQTRRTELVGHLLRQIGAPPETNPSMAAIQLKCLQCAAGLCFATFGDNQNVYDIVIQCAERASAIFNVCNPAHLYESAEQKAWFASACWSLALQPEVSLQQQFRLFSHSFQLALSSRHHFAAGQLKTYATMALLSSVSASRQATDMELKLSILRNVRSVAQEYKKAFPKWRESEDSALMVLQAEFEAAVNSGAKDSARVVDEVLAYPGADSDLLEGFVTVCQRAGTQSSPHACRLLRQCLSLKMAENPVNLDSVIRLYHMLFQALLDSCDDSGLSACVEEILKLGQMHGSSYPEAELVWMMTTAWNGGLRRLVEGNVQSAELRLRDGVRILRSLPTLRPAYERKLLADFRRLLPNVKLDDDDSQ
ncbi:testis-expressed protein 11-like [Ixodes scapularis]